MDASTKDEDEEEEITFLEASESDEIHSLVNKPTGVLSDEPRKGRRKGQWGSAMVIIVVLVGWLFALALGFYGGYQYHAYSMTTTTTTNSQGETACSATLAATTETDSATDTATPTITPTMLPTATPTTPPSLAPTPLPSYSPTVAPSHIPTPSPNMEPKETNVVCDCTDEAQNKDGGSSEDPDPQVQDNDDDDNDDGKEEDDDVDDDDDDDDNEDEDPSKSSTEDPSLLTKCQTAEETSVTNCNDDDAALPRVSFVFLSGIEGSGHHLYSTLFKESPSFKWLFPEAVDVPAGKDETEYYTSKISRAVREVIHALFRSPGSRKYVKKGLFSAPCGMHMSRAFVNGKNLMAKLVQTLRTAQELVEAKLEKKPLERVAIPLNSVSKLQPKGSGMMSYPNFNGPCRSILVPNLDLLYQACEEAQVSCQHIVIFRDAYEVIRSTTRSRHYDTTARQMTLMHPLLNMIATNIEDYPQHTAGCWDFNHAETPPWDVGRTLGWLKRKKFEKVYLDTFHEKKTPVMSDEDRNAIVPADSQVFMTGMVRATERLRQTCLKVVEERQSCRRRRRRRR